MRYPFEDFETCETDSRSLTAETSGISLLVIDLAFSLADPGPTVGVTRV